MDYKSRATISIIPPEWEEFRKNCSEIGVNMSDMVNELIRGFNSEHKNKKKFGDNYGR